MLPIEAVMIGAGNRATWSYGPYALQHPNEIRFIAVAEPDPERRARFASYHDIPVERQFASWEDVVARPQMARAAVNCTQDRMHHASTLALLAAGYDVLLEKPIAPTREECVALVEAAERLGRTLQICHVLRYTPFFTALYDIVNSGRLGRIITIDHRENVSYWHMSHSFVRGNWRNQALSAPMILAKCCHDLDILIWVMGRRVRRLSSFGSLAHYRAERAAELSPEPIPERCTDGCPIEATCPWYAPHLYGADIHQRSTLERFETRGFMLTAADMFNTLPEERWEKLKSSPYGRCVYRCDNDVVDHQTLNLEFEDGATCTFTMHGHSDREGRTLRWDGTRATLYGDFSEGRPFALRIVDHGSLKEEVLHPAGDGSGHGGGDFGLMRDFVKALNGERTKHQTTARVSLESHLLAFAAEDARREGRVINWA